jgi:glycerophosphoryl diester phosphodiesterase
MMIMKLKLLVPVVMILILTPVMKSQPLIIAHRGASYDAPENTLASVNLAWEQNADAVEVDVHMSADNKIMVIHDKDTRRTGDIHVKVSESTADELRKLDVGSFKSKEYAGEKIPFLEEVIRTIPVGKKLFVEIKRDASILPELTKLIDQSGKSEQIVIIAFDFELVEKAKAMMPEIPVYWLHYSLLGYGEKHIKKVEEAGLDGLNVHYKRINKKFAHKVIQADLGLYTWTVNDPVKAQKLVDLGIDGITTDRPEWLKEKLLK